MQKVGIKKPISYESRTTIFGMFEMDIENI